MKTKIWAHSSLHTFIRLAGTSLQTVHNIAQPVTHSHTYTSTAADNQLCCCATSMRRVYLPKLVCAWVNVCAWVSVCALVSKCACVYVCVSVLSEWNFAAGCRRSKQFLFVFDSFFFLCWFLTYFLWQRNSKQTDKLQGVFTGATGLTWKAAKVLCKCRAKIDKKEET